MSNSPGDDGPGAEQEKVDTSQANYTSSSSLGADDDLYSSGALGDCLLYTSPSPRDA